MTKRKLRIIGILLVLIPFLALAYAWPIGAIIVLGILMALLGYSILVYVGLSN